MTWLLKLYPRAWRERYGAEVAEVVAAHPRSLQLCIDLLGGAVDAHLKPQAFARRLESATADPGQGGSDMVTRLMKGCRATGQPTRRDALIGGAWSIGAALVIAAIMMIGRNPVTESIGLVMFPGVLVVGMQWMYLRGHSTLARVAIIGGMFAVLFVIGLAAGLLQGA